MLTELPDLPRLLRKLQRFMGSALASILGINDRAMGNPASTHAVGPRVRVPLLPFVLSRSESAGAGSERTPKMFEKILWRKGSQHHKSGKRRLLLVRSDLSTKWGALICRRSNRYSTRLSIAAACLFEYPGDCVWIERLDRGDKDLSGRCSALAL